MQEQVAALEEDLEKAAYERERLEVEYRQRVNEEKQNYEEKVSYSGLSWRFHLFQWSHLNIKIN